MFVIKSSGRDGVCPFETKIMPVGFPTLDRAEEYLQKTFVGDWDICDLSGIKTLYNRKNCYLYEILEVKEIEK